MAVKLNRTIIPAPFFKHSKTDPTAEEETDVVPEYLRQSWKISFFLKIQTKKNIEILKNFFKIQTKKSLKFLKNFKYQKN